MIDIQQLHISACPICLESEMIMNKKNICVCVCDIFFNVKLMFMSHTRVLFSDGSTDRMKMRFITNYLHEF